MVTTIGESVQAGLTLTTSNDPRDNPTTIISSDVKSRSTKGPWQKFVSWIWDPDYYEKSNAERKLVFKLDCALLSLLCFGWLMKYIDQTNLANAYVPGMKEDLHIEGNQYTWMQTIYNVVVCVMQLPSNLIVLKVRPSWWLAMCEIGWAIFTFAQAGAQNCQQMYAFRFFVAFFEAAFQPVAYFILGSWLFRAFFKPPSTRTWMGRCAKNGTITLTSALNLRTFKRVISKWHFWLLIPTYVCYAYGIQNYNYFGIYLKAAGYSVSARNILPACGNLIGILPQLTWGWFPTVILAVYPDSNTLKVFAFMVTGTYFVTHICVNAWLPTIIFLQTEGPRFPKGYPTVLGCNCAGMVGFTIIWLLHKRQIRQEEADLVGTVEEAGVPMEEVDDKTVDDKNVTQVSVLKA
ncbi:hypothetical protein I203_107162 [Kwoniella mangroviensis CBS 8507]|uniref:hypothetical protein n=1 Tax=Kwoniella mangroviensis CBS 8507 TaxID=1296122 RepID=UPI00080CD0EA|nr:uncharacterized protein I203_01909 [Kwoniella mangroviensis CBS 8507]OCF68526.1 hypothetical protein I203_01909 [Kwoniella mangroviensis CBS 8507]